MEKGICPNCQKAVEIQEDAQVETCLNCQKNYLTSQAKTLRPSIFAARLKRQYRSQYLHELY